MRHIVDLGRINPTCTAPRHGTTAARRYGCGCPHARRATLVEDKHRRTGRHISPLIDNTGTVRRIRALCAIGWTYAHLAERLDCTWQAVQKITLEASPRVHRITARRVVALYRELSVVPGPSEITRRRSAAKGWHTPIEWDDIDNPNEQPMLPDPVELADDEVDVDAVEAMLRGTIAYRSLRPVDRVEVYRRLRAAGAGSGAMQNRLSINSDRLRRLIEMAATAEQAVAA